MLSASGRHKVICDYLINMTIYFYLTQILNYVTRKSSILDLVFINEQLRQNGYDCNIVEGLLDYKGVIVDLNLTVPKLPSVRLY